MKLLISRVNTLSMFVSIFFDFIFLSSVDMLYFDSSGLSRKTMVFRCVSLYFQCLFFFKLYTNPLLLVVMNTVQFFLT